MSLKSEEETYISQLGEKEKVAYKIAKEHLGTSFSLKKSIGYKEWKKKQGQDLCRKDQNQSQIQTNAK